MTRGTSCSLLTPSRCASFSVSLTIAFSKLTLAFIFRSLSRRDVAQFVNSYPSIEVSFKIDEPAEGGYNASTPISVHITLDREADEEDADPSIVAPYYPAKKTPNFWVIIATNKTLQAIRKVRICSISSRSSNDCSLETSRSFFLSIRFSSSRSR